MKHACCHACAKDPTCRGTTLRPAAHECLYFWKGEPGRGCPKAHPGCPGLWAVRCGAYKLHWVTTDSVGPRRFEPQFHSLTTAGGAPVTHVYASKGM